MQSAAPSIAGRLHAPTALRV